MTYIKVKCIDHYGARPHLIEGDIYEVKEVPTNHYELKNNSVYKWHRTRFITLTEESLSPKRRLLVECIDNEHLTSILTEGKTYEVTETDVGYIYGQTTLSKTRFKVIKEITSATTTTTTTTTTKNNPAITPEWMQWRTIRDGECACGMLRTLCDYHK